MAETLFINACVRPGSRTLSLAKSVLRKLPGNITELKLNDMQLQPLDLEGMALRDRAAELKDYSHPSFLLAKQFAAADTIVIAAPYWDLLFPTVLRNYLELVSVTGVTFRYSSQGAPVGLCRAKRLYYVTTAGGFIGENNFGFSYVNALASSLYGISEVRCFAAEGLDVFPNRVDEILSDAIKKVETDNEI